MCADCFHGLSVRLWQQRFFACVSGDSVWQEKEYVYGNLVYGYGVERCVKAEYVALFVSKYYVVKEVPMEGASIAIANHADTGCVIPVYLDGTPLLANLFQPENTNYFKENIPALIAKHLVAKINPTGRKYQEIPASENKGSNMNVTGNTAEKQIFIQELSGSIEL